MRNDRSRKTHDPRETNLVEGDPRHLAPAKREAVRFADPDQTAFDIKTMREGIDEASVSRRAPMVLISLFSAVSLLLAVLGVYGVLTFAVTQRTAEFGLRIALGASSRGIAELVVREGGTLVALGIVLGLTVYLGFAQVIGKLL